MHWVDPKTHVTGRLWACLPGNCYLSCYIFRPLGPSYSKNSGNSSRASCVPAAAMASTRDTMVSVILALVAEMPWTRGGEGVLERTLRMV